MQLPVEKTQKLPSLLIYIEEAKLITQARSSDAIFMGERVNVQLCEYLSLHVCVSVCAHAHRSVFITVYTLRLCSAWFLRASRYTNRQGVHGSLSIMSPSFLFLFLFLSFALVWRPTTSPRPAYLFSAREARLLMHLLLSLPPHRPTLSCKLPWQHRRLTLFHVCPKIVSICIFGTGDVCIINLCVSGIQREL